MPHPGKRKGQALTFLLVAVLLAGGALVLLTGFGSSDDQESNDKSTFVARTGSFDITVPTSGELEAHKQIEIKNQLESRAVITEIIEEGVLVKKGEILFKLNDDEIREKIKTAEDGVNNAENELDRAKADLEIKKKERESALAEADLQIRLADLALQAWREGEVASTRDQLALDLRTAKKEHTRLKDRYESAQLLYEQKFISHDELRRDEIEAIRSEAALKQVERDIHIYETYTFVQDKERVESDLEQAREERDRTEYRFDTEVQSAMSNVDSKERRLRNEQDQLAKYRTQFEQCVVAAPADGLVVYATSLDRDNWRNDGPFQVGSELHRNQLIIALPDTSEMVAAVKVNEALSGLIKPGQRARIRSDAIPDEVLEGEVSSISVLAESGNWRDPNRRDYTVRIRLTEENQYGLKPSMRCKAEIFVDRVEDALYVPVPAVFRTGSRTFVYTQARGGYMQQPVTIGRSSDMYVEILSGLTEGETVLLYEPPLERVLNRDPTQKPEQDATPGVDVEGEEESIDDTIASTAESETDETSDIDSTAVEPAAAEPAGTVAH